MATRTDRTRRPSATILVVEHDHATRTRHRDALVTAGYQAIAVEDGIAALLYLDSHPAPDAVILDLQLPRVPGLVVYEDLRARKTTRATPIIVVTGADGAEFAPRDVIVLRKPMDEGVLVAAIIAALGETPARPA
jgi:DNA-binding response OmpR family regulator